MVCPECGRYAPPDPETGYNGDDFCSSECEEQYHYEQFCEANYDYQKENPNDGE